MKLQNVGVSSHSSVFIEFLRKAVWAVLFIFYTYLPSRILKTLGVLLFSASVLFLCAVRNRTGVNVLEMPVLRFLQAGHTRDMHYTSDVIRVPALPCMPMCTIKLYFKSGMKKLDILLALLKGSGYVK